jgi:hypothetical protein
LCQDPCGEKVHRSPQRRPGPGSPRAGSCAHLDSADQSFLLTDMLLSPGGRRVRSALRPQPWPPPPHLRPLPRAPRYDHMAAYLSPARSPRRRAPICRPGSGLWGVGVPDKAALIPARAGLAARPRAQGGRSHGPRVHRRAPGQARGCSACTPGEGGRLPAQNQSDQLGAGPPLLAVFQSGVPGSGAGGGDPKIRVRLSSRPRNRLSPEKPQSRKRN